MNPPLNIPLAEEHARELADQADRARRAEQHRRGRRFGRGVLAGVRQLERNAGSIRITD